MLGIDAKAARATWTVFLIVLFIWIVYQISEAILVMVAALLLAYLLSPPVNLVCRVVPLRWSRTASLALVYVGLVALIAAVGTWLGGHVVEQATSLANRIPTLVKLDQDIVNIPVPAWLEPMRERLAHALQDQLAAGARQALPILQRTLGGVTTALGQLVFVVLVPILTFFLLKDAAEIREHVVSLVPEKHKTLFIDVVRDIDVILAQYIRALLILSLAASIVYAIFFEIVQLQYALLLAAVAAPLEFIPFIGPLCGAAIVLTVALLTGYPHLFWLILFFAAYRLFQDYVLSPYLMSAEVELHPVVVIFGVFAGEELAGIWGMFLSIPVMATLRAVYLHVRRPRRTRQPLDSVL